MLRSLFYTRLRTSILPGFSFLLMMLFTNSLCHAQIDIVEEDSAHEIVTGSSFDTISLFTSLPAEERKVPDSAIQKIRKDKAYWYANYVPKKAQPKKFKEPGEEYPVRSWLKILLWILIIGGFIAVVVWAIASSDIRLFRKASAVINDEAEGEKSVDIHSLEYDDEINRHISEANYRMAIRLMYLRTLKDLSNAGRIHFTHEKTNRDYLEELRDTAYYKSFFKLTRDFEYTWYGKLEIPLQSFSLVQKDFETFREGLR